MESDLILALERLGLDESNLRLASLGVKRMEDLSFLREEDFISAGFSVVERRKLQSLVKPIPAQTSTPALQTPGCPLEIGVEDSDDDFGKSEDDMSPQSSVLPPSARVASDGRHLTVLSRPSSRNRRRSSAFWRAQCSGRPLRLIFIRHGESEGNVERDITAFVPDHLLHLTEEGRQQSLDAGQRLRSIVKNESVRFTISPYMRTRETLNGILQAWEPHEHRSNWIREDVRIREQEYGNYDSPDIKRLHALKKQFGRFYFRFPEGESLADCFDRASLFVESMYRAWSDNLYRNHVIVGHGVMILVILMRLLRLPVEEFENLDRLSTCEFVVLERTEKDAKYHVAYTWQNGHEPDREGIRRTVGAGQMIRQQAWSGNPDEPLLRSR